LSVTCGAQTEKMAIIGRIQPLAQEMIEGVWFQR
jgi:hypothetical protein